MTQRALPTPGDHREPVRSGSLNTIAILHRDEHVLVVFKPSGVLSVPSTDRSEASLPQLLEHQGLTVLPVHRLDRDVSGAIVFALDAHTRGLLEDMFRRRALKKTYWALAQGVVQPSSGSLRYPIVEEHGRARVSVHGKKSVTNYCMLESFSSTTAVEIELVTGRYNQIRLHFAHAGFPLVGERKYAVGRNSPIRTKNHRIALHSWHIAFEHPLTKHPLDIEAPLPSDLLELRLKAAQL